MRVHHTKVWSWQQQPGHGRWLLPRVTQGSPVLAAPVPAGAERGGGEVAGGEELVLTRSPTSRPLQAVPGEEGRYFGGSSAAPALL